VPPPGFAGPQRATLSSLTAVTAFSTAALVQSLIQRGWKSGSGEWLESLKADFSSIAQMSSLLRTRAVFTVWRARATGSWRNARHTKEVASAASSVALQNLIKVQSQTRPHDVIVENANDIAQSEHSRKRSLSCQRKSNPFAASLPNNSFRNYIKGARHESSYRFVR